MIESSSVESQTHKTKVLMISYDHLVIDRRILQQARSLTQAGYDVTVVSGFESPHEDHYIEAGVKVYRYHYDPINAGNAPAFIGYLNRIPGMGRITNIINRLRQILREIRQLPDNRWSINSILQLYHFSRQDYQAFVWHTLQQHKADIVHVHDLPLLWMGDQLAKQWRARLVYDAHEIYYEQDTLSSAQKEELANQERRLMKNIDIFSTVNGAIAEYFSSIHGVTPLVLLNCTDMPHDGFNAKSRSMLREKSSLPENAKVVLYQGWFSHERNLLTLVQAAEFLSENAYLVLIGYGEYGKELHAVLEGKPWADKVRFIGQIDSKEIMVYTAGADLGVIPYQAVDLNHKLCSPNKFFEYVQAGVPVLAQDLIFFREMAALYGVVSACDLSNIFGMAAEIKALIDNGERLEKMRVACHEAAKTLNWETEGKKLVNAYSKLKDKPIRY
jgi:glycosyltransferase involved in cell wall biosynthesis